MNKVIQNVLSSDNLSISKLIECLEMVKEQGNNVVIKLDGGRTENQYTVFISFPLESKREMIRSDSSTLLEGLKTVLTSYTQS